MLRRTAALTALIVGLSFSSGTHARAADPTPAAVSRPASGPTAASPPQTRAQRRAAELLQRGRELFARKDFDGAWVQFEAVYKLRPTWRMLIFLGITQLRRFHYGEAVKLLREYLRRGGKAVSAAERARVQNELAQLRATVATVTVKVQGGPAAVRVDGKVVGRSPLAEPLLLAPRFVTIGAVRPGYEVDERELKLQAGERRTLTLTPKQQRALLAVDSKPRGAKVLIDDHERGATPWQAQLPLGSYRLRLQLAGYKGHEETLTLDGRTPWQRSIVLDALPKKPRRWYQRWYVWAAIGAVVVGAAIGTTVGIVEATRPSYTLTFNSNAAFERSR